MGRGMSGPTMAYFDVGTRFLAYEACDLAVKVRHPSTLTCTRNNYSLKGVLYPPITVIS